VAAQTGAGLCAMHTGRERKRDNDVVTDHFSYLNASLAIIRQAGVEDNQIVLDPGFGFAKDPHENLQLLSRFEELHALGFPLLAGTSRKRFIGDVIGRDAEDRDIATAATSVVARMKGGSVFRVHDVPSNRDALLMSDAILHGSEGGN
ncbi:MAG: dihydropteroate synthase, partial [Pseudomonadota bacterium]